MMQLFSELPNETKADMRNYAMVAGFMVGFVWSLTCMVPWFGGNLEATTVVLGATLLGIMYLIIGTVLAGLGGRDLIAILFLLSGLSGVTLVLTANAYACVPYNVVMVIFAVIILFTKDEQKWIVAPLLFLQGMYAIAFFTGIVMVEMIAEIIASALLLYMMVAIVCDRYDLPFRETLTIDYAEPSNDGEQVPFKTAGSVLGYLVIASVAVCFMIRYLFPDIVTMETTVSLCFAYGITMVLAGLIVFFVGKMRYTPLFFIFIGIAYSVEGLDPAFGLVTGIVYLVVALLTFIRNDRRILAGVMVLLMGIVVLVNNLTGFTDPMFALCMEIPIAVIPTYIAAALVLDKRLPLI